MVELKKGDLNEITITIEVAPGLKSGCRFACMPRSTRFVGRVKGSGENKKNLNMHDRAKTNPKGKKNENRRRSVNEAGVQYQCMRTYKTRIHNENDQFHKERKLKQQKKVVVMD